MRILLFALLGLSLSLAPRAAQAQYPIPYTAIQQVAAQLPYQSIAVDDAPKPGKALFLCVVGGYLGLHRAYLGTSHRALFFYMFTLGGGGFLWIMDLGMLLKAIGPHSDRFETYIDNPRIYMG